MLATTILRMVRGLNTILKEGAVGVGGGLQGAQSKHCTCALVSWQVNVHVRTMNRELLHLNQTRKLLNTGVAVRQSYITTLTLTCTLSSGASHFSVCNTLLSLLSSTSPNKLPIWFAVKLLLSRPVLWRVLASLLTASPELITGPPMVLLSLLLFFCFASWSVKDIGVAAVLDCVAAPVSSVSDIPLNDSSLFLLARIRNSLVCFMIVLEVWKLVAGFKRSTQSFLSFSSSSLSGSLITSVLEGCAVVLLLVSFLLPLIKWSKNIFQVILQGPASLLIKTKTIMHAIIIIIIIIITMK